MKSHKLNNIKLASVTLFVFIFLFAGVLQALEIQLIPHQAQRKVDQQVRVQFWATGAEALISMGIKITYDSSILQVVNAAKNVNFDTGWMMDADGELNTDNDRYTLPDVEDDSPGTVIMIGGRLKGEDTLGLFDDVLLGWIDFKAIGNGYSHIGVDLGRYHPDHPDETYDNFVKLNGENGEVDEPTNLGDLGLIYVGEDACLGDADANGVCNIVDKVLVRNEFGRDDCYDPEQRCAGDVDGSGVVNVLDKVAVRNNFGQDCCTITPPE